MTNSAHGKRIGRLMGLLGVALLCHLPMSNAAEFRSGPRQVALLELYTSEGCSSCPPADRWLSGLKDDPRLWSELVPVGFHVDYWDYLGWKDRFASKRYSSRQHAYARSGGIRTVYTPGFVVNGQEWRGWFSDPNLKISNAPDTGTLVVSADDGGVVARYVPRANTNERHRLHIAITGFDISTAVEAGENSGRRLTHDFVVLGYDAVSMQRDGETLTASSSLPVQQIDATRRAVAVWVTREDDPTALQSAGGWLD
jgi:hypothetical protein